MIIPGQKKKVLVFIGAQYLILLACSSYFARKGAKFPEQPAQLVNEGLNYAVLLQECLLIGWTLFILK